MQLEIWKPLNLNPNQQITIYTDGASKGNPGRRKKVIFEFRASNALNDSNTNFSTLFDSDYGSVELVILNPQTGKEEVVIVSILKSIYEQEQRQ